MTKADASGVEADIDVLDEHGTVLLACQGLRLGTGISEAAQQDRVLGRAAADHRMAASENLPETEHVDAGTWLLISTARPPTGVATDLADALKSRWRDSARRWCWPQHADHRSTRTSCASSCAPGVTGVVVLTGTAERRRPKTSPRCWAASTCGTWCASPANCRRPRVSRLVCTS